MVNLAPRGAGRQTWLATTYLAPQRSERTEGGKMRRDVCEGGVRLNSPPHTPATMVRWTSTVLWLEAHAVPVRRKSLLTRGNQMPRTPPASMIGSFVVIAVVIGGVATAFAYTAGWLSPDRLTPSRLVAALAPPRRPGGRSPAQPRKGHLLHGEFRLERRRVGAVRSAGVPKGQLSGHRAVQPGRPHAHGGRWGVPRTRDRRADHNARRSGMAHGDDRPRRSSLSRPHRRFTNCSWHRQRKTIRTP